jgi:hypothetical protein
MVRLLLEETRVLETHDEVEFFFFHARDLRLIALLLARLLLQLALDLGPGAILSVDEIHLALAGGLLLLVLDHHFDVLSLLFLQASAVFPLLPSSCLLGLSLVSLKLRPCITMHLVLGNRMEHLLLNLGVLLGHHCLFGHALLLTVLTLGVSFDIAATLVDDVTGALPGLVNFADSLYFFRGAKSNLPCLLPVSAGQCGYTRA